MMHMTLLQTVITTIGTILVALITVVMKSWLDNRRDKAHKEREETITEEDVEYMTIIQEWLEEFRNRYEFERSAIFQFHNGGKFFHGKSMKKFSMTYEAVAPGYEKMKRNMQNILTSEYPHWVGDMLKKKCFAYLTTELENKERKEFEHMGVQQLVIVPIYCLRGNLIGFIAGYNIADIDENISEHCHYLVEDSKFISGYLL